MRFTRFMFPNGRRAKVTIDMRCMVDDLARAVARTEIAIRRLKERMDSRRFWIAKDGGDAGET